jgi:hypothetical protein
MKLNLCWKSDSHSVGQEIPRLLWNQKFHYRVQERKPLGPNLKKESAQVRGPVLQFALSPTSQPRNWRTNLRRVFATAYSILS